MKNPKSKYISSVRKVMKARQIRNILILSCCVLLILFSLLVVYMSFLKEDIDRTFQNDSSISSEELGNSETNETFPLDMPSQANSEVDLDETDDSSLQDSTNIDLLIDRDTVGFGFFTETEHFVFDTDLVLQTVTYGERDIAFARLKQSIRQYLENESQARIGIRYINLHSNEAFGFNDLSPFVFAATMNLPVNFVLYEQIGLGNIHLTDLILYSGPNSEDALSLIDIHFKDLDHLPEQDSNEDVLPEGSNEGDENENDDPESNLSLSESTQNINDPDKPRYLSIRELSYLSIVHGDATATQMLINHLGGIEVINDRLLSISGVVDFLGVRHYTDYQNVQHSGTRRSSAYDMARYYEYLYYQYRMRPDIYQPLINDLARSESEWGIYDGLSGSAFSLNKNGYNAQLGSMSDLAFIVAQEPYILCIVVESNNAETGRRIIRELSEMIDSYFDYCFS